MNLKNALSTAAVVVAVGIASLLLPRSAGAVPSDFDIVQTPGVLVSLGSSADGSFDLTAENPAFVPGVDIVASGWISFSLLNFNQIDTVDIFVDANQITNGAPVNMMFQSFGQAGGMAVFSMQDGIIDWLVEAQSGDGFLLSAVALHAEVDRNSHGTSPVPESGTTVALLGAVMIGLGGLRRFARQGDS